MIAYITNIEGIDFVKLEECDVVRHKLVVNILSAYAKNAGV